MELHRQCHATGTEQRPVEVEIGGHERVRPRAARPIALDGEQGERLVVRGRAGPACRRCGATRSLGFELAQQPARLLRRRLADGHAEHPYPAARRGDEGADAASWFDEPQLREPVNCDAERGD